jgi:hypothetical protein
VKQKFVGHYLLGAFNVEVYLRDGSGGEFYYAPEPAALPRLKAGIEGGWYQVFAVVLHEAAEFSLSNIRCRYQHDDTQLSSDRFVFHANHYEFSTMTNDVGAFLASMTPDLAKAYRAWPRGAK